MIDLLESLFFRSTYHRSMPEGDIQATGAPALAMGVADAALRVLWGILKALFVLLLAYGVYRIVRAVWREARRKHPSQGGGTQLRTSG